MAIDDIFLSFAQNVDCWCSLEPLHEAVLTSTTIYAFNQNKKDNVFPENPTFSDTDRGFPEC